VRLLASPLTVLALTVAVPVAAETVTGTATYRERLMLPPGAVLEVTVEDVARAGAPAEVVGQSVLTPRGGPPWPFEVAVDPSRVTPASRLTLRATLRRDGTLIFTTDRLTPVLTGDAPSHADLVLVRVSSEVPTLAGTAWRITALDGAPLPSEARDPVLRFETGEGEAPFAASAGCNRFAGTASIQGDTLAFGPVRATRMGCPPPLDTAEAALSAALGETLRWEIADGTLRLSDAQGAVRIEAIAAN
jgi:putative lipoprotein